MSYLQLKKREQDSQRKNGLNDYEGLWHNNHLIVFVVSLK